MTRKDFELIARVVSDAMDECNMSGTSSVRIELVRLLCEGFSECNDRFDAARFRRACGVTHWRGS